MHKLTIALLGGLLAVPAYAQNTAPADPAPPAGTTAPAADKNTATAPPPGATANDVRPAYNINEGADRIGSFANGEQQLRAHRD